jgi:hypothetical protein
MRVVLILIPPTISDTIDMRFLFKHGAQTQVMGALGCFVGGLLVIKVFGLLLFELRLFFTDTELWIGVDSSLVIFVE